MNLTTRKWPESWVSRTSLNRNIPLIHDLSGIVCCTVTVIFFAAPLSKILHVVRTRNSECLPFPLIVANFIVCLQWVIYGIAIGDRFIQVRATPLPQKDLVSLSPPFFADSQHIGLFVSKHPIVAFLLLPQSEHGRPSIPTTDTGRLIVVWSGGGFSDQ